VRATLEPALDERALGVGDLRRVVQRHQLQHRHLLVDRLRVLLEQLGRMQRHVLLRSCALWHITQRCCTTA
jgi:hypothetical protein